MTWIILDDTLADDPRILRAGGFSALGAVAACVGYCNRALSDGFIPREALPRVGLKPAMLRALLAHDLLVETPDGYDVAEDIVTWQKSRERVLRERRQKAERQARWRERVDASRNPSTDASRDAPVDAALPVPPRPVPKGRGGSRGAREGAADRPRCPHGRILAADGAGCAECDQLPLAVVS